jgi:hypothetical protein
MRKQAVKYNPKSHPHQFRNVLLASSEPAAGQLAMRECAAGQLTGGQTAAG